MALRDEVIKNSKSGLNCSQSVISTFSRSIRLDDNTAKAVSAAFGGGMGYLGKTCGAVSASIMAIGYKYFDKDDLKGSKKKAYEKAREFIMRFEEKFGCSDCRDLLGVDLNSGDGLSRFREENMFEEKCSDYLKAACDILDDIFQEE